MSNQDEPYFSVTDKGIVELQLDPGDDDVLRRMVEKAAHAKREAEASGSPFQIHLSFLLTRGLHGPQDYKNWSQLTQAELDLVRTMYDGFFVPVGMAVRDMSARCISTIATETGVEQEWEILILIK